ncbi:hypothetical protein IU11_06790 [Cellulosimicrobium sp. MM]|nr:hypothetical protein [Cellulosimicrobium sp. MM]KFD43949.1 hypothetical protein IU11_06790 [Cellulosimicrobium sp. MM]
MVLRTMRERLLDLADWTEERARTTGRDDLREHAALYRGRRAPAAEVRWLPVPHQQGAEMRHRLPLTLDVNWTSVQ